MGCLTCSVGSPSASQSAPARLPPFVHDYRAGAPVGAEGAGVVRVRRARLDAAVRGPAGGGGHRERARPSDALRLQSARCRGPEAHAQSAPCRAAPPLLMQRLYARARQGWLSLARSGRAAGEPGRMTLPTLRRAGSPWRERGQRGAPARRSAAVGQSAVGLLSDARMRFNPGNSSQFWQFFI